MAYFLWSVVFQNIVMTTCIWNNLPLKKSCYKYFDFVRRKILANTVSERNPCKIESTKDCKII